MELLLLELELPVLITQSTDVDLAIADGRHLAAKLFDLIAHVKVILENFRHIAVDLELLLPAYLLIVCILGDLLQVRVSLRPGALELLGKPVQLAIFLSDLALKVALALHLKLQFLHLLLQLGNLRQRLFLFLQVAHLLG